MGGKNHQTDSQGRKVTDAKAAALARLQAVAPLTKNDLQTGAPMREKSAMTGAPEKK